jgi:hypothetical protein
MDLQEVQDAKNDLDVAYQKLRYWQAPSRAPERAGALKTQARRRLRIQMLEARVDELRAALRNWQ